MHETFRRANAQQLRETSRKEARKTTDTPCLFSKTELQCTYRTEFQTSTYVYGTVRLLYRDAGEAGQN